MFNTSKLRGRIIEVFGSLTMFADALNIPFQQVSKVLNGKTFLRQDAIYKWAVALEIELLDIPAYFFVINTHKGELSREE